MAGTRQQIAVVTGGNRGIGFEVCRRLAQEGFRVLLAGRDDAGGSEAAERLRTEGLDVGFARLDVSDSGSVSRFAADAAQNLARLDVLVNNAGVSLKGFNVDVVQRTLATNFFGALEVTDRLLPLMGAGGRIVMVSSGMGEISCLAPALRREFLAATLTRQELIRLLVTFIEDVRSGRHTESGWPSSAYRVSKAGLNALTRVLAGELRGSGILVNSVCPGWVRTGMGGRFAPRSAKKGAETIVWASMLPRDGPSGRFFRDRKAIPW
jgi:NAD(P)-dependent dehydrogenase (short-subunit alcohol dehydrogenase family)